MSERDFDIISLDLETSGTEDEHTILSIGCVRLSDMTSFYADVRHESLVVTPKSMQINGIDIMQVANQENRQTLTQVDKQFREWLKSDPFYQEGKKYALIPMGMNVGTFDMRFVKKHLTKSADLFGYRSIDLNALIFTDAFMRGEKFQTVKSAAKVLGTTYAQEHVPHLKPHHALYDAYSNIGVFNYLVNSEFSGKLGPVAWEGGKPFDV